MLRPVVFCFVVLLATEYITEAIALAEGDEGVCVGKISSAKTKKVSYTRYNNKWCGKRKCVVRASRNQRFVVNTNVMMCCSGWQYQGEACVPRCSTGCFGGRCVGPERCQCDAPTFHDPQHQNICLTPVCNPPCVNAQCANNTCTCLPNFHTFNVSHCYQCDPGYDIDANFNCIPKCDHCLNGVCTAPGVCTCSPGYILKDFTCTPECEGCVNSECVAPNTCACLKSFSPINSTHCKSNCEHCEHGTCESPGVCKCDKGFSKTNGTGTCLPFCNSTCENGVCTAPDVCTCNESYQKNETHPHVCFKPCVNPCEGTCNLHGECICQVTSKYLMPYI